MKICGLTREEDAKWAIECGADALGFIHEPSSPRYIGEEPPKWISGLPILPMKIAVFGRVTQRVSKTIFDAVQGAEWDNFPEPATKRIHVVQLRPNQSARDLVSMTINAAALLLDAYHPQAYGGTGIKVDWDLAAEVVALSSVPVILAGGLTPENVVEAIQKVRPFCVDVSSGVEVRPGIKDHQKIMAFIQAAKGA